MGPSVPPASSSTIVCRSTGGLRDLGGRGDQAALQLPGAATFADDQVAQHAGAGAAVVRRHPGGLSPGADLVAAGVVGLGCQQAVVGVHDLVPAPPCVEPQDQLALALAERVLELVAIAPALQRRLDRRQLEAVQASEAAQRVVDLLLLDAQLLLVGEPLPWGAGARLAAVVAAVGDAVGAGAQQLHGPRLGVVALALRDRGEDPVAGEGSCDEDDVAIAARDPLAAVGEGLDVQLELFGDPWSRGLLLGLCHRFRLGGSLADRLLPQFANNSE